MDSKITVEFHESDLNKVGLLLRTLTYDQIEQLSGCYPTAPFIDAVNNALGAIDEAYEAENRKAMREAFRR